MLRINTARYANLSRLLENRVLPKAIDKMQGKMTKTYLYPKKSAKIDNSEAKSERISCIYETRAIDSSCWNRSIYYFTAIKSRSIALKILKIEW